MKLIELYSKYKVIFNLAGIGLTLSLIMHGILQMLLINILTFIYLTYKTIRLLECGLYQSGDVVVGPL